MVKDRRLDHRYGAIEPACCMERQKKFGQVGPKTGNAEGEGMADWYGNEPGAANPASVHHGWVAENALVAEAKHHRGFSTRR